MNAIDLLKSQHREVEKIFELIEKSKSSTEKTALMRDVADSLAGHAAIEEQIFYPSVMENETEDMLREAVEEHLAVKRVIVDLLETSVEDESFDAKVKVLKEQVEHHVKEEEGELFSRVKKDFSADSLEEMGTKMEAVFAELEGENPRNDVRDEIEEAAPLPEPRPQS